MIVLFSCLMPCLSAGQDPKDLFEKAPPDVDEALRGRITKFYHSFVDGKYHDAYDMVAEDSKDTFLGSDKYTCTKVEIVKINYSENFTRATTLVSCASEFVARGNKFPTNIPITGFWKVEGGKWCWYTVPRTQGTSPFGTLRSAPGGPPQAEPVVPEHPLPKMPDLKEILSMVKLDKYQVQLSSFEPGSDQVVVTNDMPGQLTLSIEPPSMPGLEVQAERTVLKPHESSKVTFQFKPSNKRAKEAIDVSLLVEPLRAKIPIHVVFANPPERK
jgi:hypothetical protein